MSCPPGSARNRLTGRCRKSCESHQARNPATGRCVTRNYLRRVQRRCYGEDDMIYAPYGMGSKKDYRDGLVPDPACYPRKRNIFTGRCKTPCGPGYATNWRTGQCVTLGFLRTIDPTGYEIDGDDDDTAHILFTPTDLATGGGIIKPYDNDVTTQKGFTRFNNNTITENDLVVLRAAYNISSGKGERIRIVGAYSPDKRKKTCSQVAKSGFNDTNFSLCGLTNVSMDGDIADLVEQNANLQQNVFAFVTHEHKILQLPLMLELATIAQNHPVRVLVANFYGVWRILIPRVKEDTFRSLRNSIMLIDEKMKSYDSSTHINPRQLALEVHKVCKQRQDLHVSFAPYVET